MNTNLVAEPRVVVNRLLRALLGQPPDHLKTDASYVTVVSGLVKLAGVILLASVCVQLA